MNLKDNQRLKVRLDPRGGLEFILIERAPSGTRYYAAHFVSGEKLQLARKAPVQLEVLQEFLHRNLQEEITKNFFSAEKTVKSYTQS